MIGGIQLSGPCEPRSGGRLVLGLAYSRLAPSVQAVAYSQSLPADWVSHRLGLVPPVGPGHPPPVCGGKPVEFRSLGGDGFIKPHPRNGRKSKSDFLR